MECPICGEYNNDENIKTCICGYNYKTKKSISKTQETKAKLQDSVHNKSETGTKNNNTEKK